MLTFNVFFVLLVAMSSGQTKQEYEESESISASFSASKQTSEGYNPMNRVPCFFRGRFFIHLDSFSLDPCTLCSCKNGTISCHIEDCPSDLQCSSGVAVVKEGECCEQCEDSPLLEQDCEFRGRVIQYEQQLHLDPCTVCTCRSFGRVDCHVSSCPGRTDCKPTELIVSPDHCCPFCPFKMMVSSVRISYDHEIQPHESSTNTLRFGFHVEVEKSLSSATVQGDMMWRLGAWLSQFKDGSGVKMSFQSNIFNAEDSARSFHRRNPSNFKWLDLEYNADPEQELCGNYFCVEFDEHHDPSPLNDIPFTFQAVNNERERLIACIPYPNCHDDDVTPELHTDLKLKHLYERNLGDVITFKCNVTNARNIWWKHSSWKKTERVSSSSTFRIDNITLADQGSYNCQARGHGQHITSAEQILVISGLLQFLLTISTTKSNPSNLQERIRYQMHIANKLEEANLLVIPLNASTETNTTELYLNTRLNLGQEVNTMKRNVQNIVSEATVPSGLFNISDFDVGLEGLSLCFEEMLPTEFGNLSFSSAALSKERESNQRCVVPSTLPRASRRCEGNLVTPARWANLDIRNCFNSSVQEETNKRVDSFFQIIGNRSLTIRDVIYISRDLVDITKAKTVETEDISRISSVLNMVSSVHSTSPLVTYNTLHTVDKIMEAAQAVNSNDEQLPVGTPSGILKSVEMQLESTEKSGKNFALSLPNIGVNVVQISDLEEPFSYASCLSSDIKDNSRMPVNKRNSYCKEGAFIYIPSVVTNLQLNDLNQKVIPVTFTRYESDILFNDEKLREKKKKINSIVIAVSTSNEIKELPKYSFIQTTLSPLSADNFKSNFKCVSWNYTLYKDSGGWSTEGCLNEEYNDSFTYICKCDHFGHFAVLVDLENEMRVRWINNPFVVVCIIVIFTIFAAGCTYFAIKAFKHHRKEFFRKESSFQTLVLSS